MRNNKKLLASGPVSMTIGIGELICLICVLMSCTVTQPVPPDYEALYHDLLYPSVRITTSEGIGSGVIISHRVTEGTENTIYILTAGHVVGNEALVSVELFGSTESLPAFVVLTDTGKDLALLRCASGVVRHASVFVAKLAPKDYGPYIFTPIWAVGCSLGLPTRPSEGIITSLCALSDSVANYWEVNAPIWPGNSGGGVFLKDSHELIGIAVWVRVYHGQLVSTMAGVVPLQTIYEFLEGVKSYAEKESD
jgi:S1-C subfamily serine protease